MSHYSLMSLHGALYVLMCREAARQHFYYIAILKAVNKSIIQTINPILLTVERIVISRSAYDIIRNQYFNVCQLRACNNFSKRHIHKIFSISLKNIF